MSSIDIRHDHSRTPAQARAAIEDAARKLTDRYGIASHWEGDTLRIARAGVDGAINLLPQQVHVTAELGFLLSAMQPMVESEIRRLLAEKLA
ncbi:polyhydroxyalkanoic acid system family protein [Xanthomonas campestris pv. raphani]|uniref:polyhydroxyalkanoic acid system family protein n=1 Tax=Xanthomonas campestris TaxID=339 RepID=UPI000E32C22F|nr:polyhydroxyalkanoic acid system family protein [Xanthomonas campestris]MCC5084117.1 polyhydroxyalkanoic acid system family protein [Xanthomonas campestris]MEA9491597.1 polyhydroxyalkanoic acid system family protein [Xanthomonas campestris]MEA9510200.1 polyhydroxyalkanoic acid system family protein [Xanthomonas campestris]MEA9575296.1 polyhydroxyalkanoic acid system family protein [Xanthomonas campestris]MEA9740137.1 polyhydroxyalkanoic acid system family protein [Xanthomonas campestris pv. 